MVTGTVARRDSSMLCNYTIWPSLSERQFQRNLFRAVRVPVPPLPQTESQLSDSFALARLLSIQLGGSSRVPLNTSATSRISNPNQTNSHRKRDTKHVVPTERQPTSTRTRSVDNTIELPNHLSGSGCYSFSMYRSICPFCCKDTLRGKNNASVHISVGTVAVLRRSLHSL